MTDQNPYAAPDPRFGTPPTQGAPAGAPPPTPPYQQFPPPAYQPAYPPADQSYPVIRGNQGLGTALLILGAVYVAALVLQAATAQQAVDEYDRAVLTGQAVVSTAHDVVGILFLVLIPLWIVGSIWLHRAYQNASALIPANMHRSAVWCYLGWLVPIVSYWFPKQIVDDCWHTTSHYLPATSKGRRRSTALWWGVWVAFVVLNSLTLRFDGFASSGSATPAPGQSFDPHHGVHPGVEALLAVLAVAAYAAWVPIVLGVSRAQEDLKSRFAQR